MSGALAARSRPRLLALAAAALALLAPSELAASGADKGLHGCAFESGLGNGECQHFLRNPSAPTDDPCWCDKCRNGITGQQHDGRTMPKGWNPTLFEIGGMDHYLKRHSIAWGIQCSACFQNDKPWPDGDGKNPGTAPAKDWAGRPARETVLKRFNTESRLFKKPDEVVVAYNRHFYVTTDIDGLKAKTPGGTARMITRHEWVHLMIERAEYARREFARNFGPTMPEAQKPGTVDPIPVAPIAMFFTEKQRDFDRVSAQYFKAAGNKGLKGAGARMCDDICLTGLGGCRERIGDDHELTAFMRHQIGHNLMSIWGSWQTRPKSMPTWLEEGAAQWLTKSIPQFEDDAVWCTGEGAATGASAPSYSEKDWEKDVAKWAGSAGRLGAIEELLAKTVIGDMSEEDLKRSWSYFAVCLEEWREPFVKMVAALRQEKDVREAFMSTLGCTPEVFDERWRERVTGRRKSIAPGVGEDEPEENDTPGARDRRAIRRETDPNVLAARVRQLGEIKDPKTIPVVVDVMAQNLDLARETALVTLLRTKDPACLQALADHGLAHPDGIVRAYTARICGRLKITSALPKIEAMLEDRNWYARAEAAVACGTLKHAKAIPALRKMVASDPSDKAQVGAIDALAMFGEDAGEPSVPLIAKHLASSQWQLRVAACQGLAEIGKMQAVEALVTRMEQETGRVQDAIYEALCKITRDNLGRRPENWRKWWDAERKANPNGLPKRPDAPPEKPKGPDPNDPRATRDAPAPPYFGVEIYSSRIAFVCDTSESMLMLFTPDPAAAKALSREYVGNDKLTICKQEIAQTLDALDPRAHFNVVTFGTQIRTFQRNPVPATKGNVASAIDFLRSIQGAGETNYYDALKAALDIGDEPDTNADFKATPDTITFLTDGEPTKGAIIDADVLLEWYTGLNRYARVKTHTVTFGLVNVDMPLLRGLAEKNGGKFTLVPEANKRRR